MLLNIVLCIILCLFCVFLSSLLVRFMFPKSVVFFTSNGETIYRETDYIKFTKKRLEKVFNVTIVKARVFDSYRDYIHSSFFEFTSFPCFHDIVFNNK